MQYISWAEYWYNTSYHEATKCTPFEVVYGRPPPSITRYILGETAVKTVAQDLMNRDETLRQLKFHLLLAQDQMSKFANKHRKPASIKVGDEVYLNIRPHKQQSMPTRLHSKLSARYYEPFLVLAKVGSVAFKLQLPEGAHIHPVFHVSQFKRVIGKEQAEATIPPEFKLGEGLIPKKVLQIRTIDKDRETVKQALIQWKKGEPKLLPARI